MHGVPLQLEIPDPAAEPSAISVRRSSRARRLSLRVHRDARVEVVAPPRFSAEAIAEFVNRHRQWIDRHRQEALRRRPPSGAFPPAQIELRALGETWRVHLSAGTGPIAARERAAGLLELSGAEASSDGVRRALLRWLMLHCKQPLERALHAMALRHGFRYGSMVLRRQRTRWGSCSVRGTISLNVCLAFQRPEVLDYLLLHELVHTRHMNHSREFWSCLARHCPDWAARDRELRDGWRQVPTWVFKGATHD